MPSTRDLADIEDACSFAWVQFFRYQPSRDREWRGWLFRTAQREAWRLNAQQYAERPMLHDTDGYEERLEFQAALEELHKLPEHLRAVVLLNAAVGRHADVAAILGVSRQHVGYLLQQVSVAVQDRAERRAELERPVASPRAARLRELQDEPPEWLLNTIGRVPPLGKSTSGCILAWRRAALAIDDYRRVSGWTSAGEGVGPTPTDPPARRAHQRAERTIAQFHEERQRRHGRLRER